MAFLHFFGVQNIFSFIYLSTTILLGNFRQQNRAKIGDKRNPSAGHHSPRPERDLPDGTVQLPEIVDVPRREIQRILRTAQFRRTQFGRQRIATRFDQQPDRFTFFST